MSSYTQCQLQYESFNDPTKVIIDTMFIPTKFAKKNKMIIVDKPVKRKVKVLQVFSTSTKTKVERRRWDKSIPPREDW